MTKHSLELENISKRFGGIVALDDISFKLEAGKIYGLAGENGAGKSTTMKIINGAYIPDSGEIRLNGETVHFSSPQDAQEAGIGMVYQELNMLPDLSVTENIYISHLSSGRFGYVDWKTLHRNAAGLLANMEIDIDPHTRLGDLKVAYQQLVAIVRVLAFDCRLVILDEPTSALTDKDSAHVLKAVERLRELGYIVIYISHKLSEVLSITDEVIVFRNGKLIGQYDSNELDENRLSELIAGRKLENKFPKMEFQKGKELLRVEDLVLPGHLQGVSFALHEGEILGFAGLLGAGKTEIARSLFGVYGRGEPRLTGRVFLEGKELDLDNPQDAIRHKIGLVPENRGLEGLVPEMSIHDNIIMPSLKQNSQYGWLKKTSGRALAEDIVRRLEIKCAGIHHPVTTLSGGNQQKVVLAKWIVAGARIIVFDEPTRGIDVGAKVVFYELMNKLVEQGIGVIILSSENEEVVNMSDSLIVMKEGRVSARLGARRSLDEVYRYM